MKKSREYDETILYIVLKGFRNHHGNMEMDRTIIL